MAKETLTAQQASRTGAQISRQSVTAAGGFEFPNDGKTLLLVNNDAVDMVLVFTIQKKLDGQTATRTVTVTASQDWVVGPFPTELYNDASGYVFCTPDTDLATGVAVIQY